MKPKTGIFVDVQNIYYTTKHAYSRQFNYRALWQAISSTDDIVLALAYAVERHDARQQAFQEALRHIGFTVKLKPYIQRADGSSKGDWDVGITIDVMQQASQLDRVVLLSGDGDFDILAQTIQQLYNINFDVYGVPTLSADSIQQSASNFYAIDTPLLL